jgi:hypothetical protein
LVKYIFSNVEDITPEEFQSIVSETLSDDKGGLIMTLAEKLRNEGRILFVMIAATDDGNSLVFDFIY